MENDGGWRIGALALLCLLALWALINAQPAPLVAPEPKGAFTGKVVLVLLQDKAHASTRAGRSLWGVERPVTYRTHAGDTITVPAGMVTDLASIPRPLWVLLPADGPWAQAAVFHDLCYATRGTGVWHGHHGNSRAAPYTRTECDRILLDAMLDLEIPQPQRTVIWAGVRLGGAAGWGH